MDENFWGLMWVLTVLWVGWPLHAIAGHLAALRKKAGA